MIFFTADHHYGDASIIKYEDRPFKDVDYMEKSLILNHNSVIGKEDTVYFIGDFAFWSEKEKDDYKRVISQLNGQKHLILGNHDIRDPFFYIELGFFSVHTSLKIHTGRNITNLDDNVDIDVLYLNHDPCTSIIDKTKIWLCGHIHSLFKFQKNAINVGVDVWDYYPVSLDQIVDLIKTQYPSVYDKK